MVNLNKLCFINFTMKTCQKVKETINAGFVLKEFPTEPKLKYTRFDGEEEIIKVNKCKTTITDVKKQECLDAFNDFNKGLDEHLRDEVAKLVAITGATLSKREEQLFIIRQTFNPKKGE